MKFTAVLLLLLFHSFISSAQDSLQIKTIDSLQDVINRSTLTLYTDSSNRRDSMEMSGYSIITSSRFKVSYYSDDSSYLRKLIYVIDGTQVFNGKEKNIHTISVFYYNKDKLIKTDETVLSQEKISFQYYFFNDQLLYCSANSEKTKPRGPLLLQFSEQFLQQFRSLQNKKSLPNLMK